MAQVVVSSWAQFTSTLIVMHIGCVTSSHGHEYMPTAQSITFTPQILQQPSLKQHKAGHNPSAWDQGQGHDLEDKGQGHPTMMDIWCEYGECSLNRS